jgi:solute carrier family 50 protein (sugar transporter)
MLLAWSVVLVWVGWVHPSSNKNTAETIGWVVNVNLVFFYGAPLQTMWTVIREKCSDSIHRPTMVMNWFCTTFWLLYGMIQLDPIIFLPNGVGLLLGMSQGFLCLLYPNAVDLVPLTDEPFALVPLQIV